MTVPGKGGVTLLILNRIHKKGREDYFKGNINITFAKAK